MSCTYFFLGFQPLVQVSRILGFLPYHQDVLDKKTSCVMSLELSRVNHSHLTFLAHYNSAWKVNAHWFIPYLVITFYNIEFK